MAVPEIKFLGRYQELILVKKAFGIEVNDSEVLSAIQRDMNEHKKIFQEVQDIEEFLNSDLFVKSESSSIIQEKDKIRKIISEGYETCVLQNDQVLDERCFKILDFLSTCLKNLFIDNGKTVPEELVRASKEVKDQLSIQGFMLWVSLGHPPLLNEPGFQQMWLIIDSLQRPEKKFGSIDARHYLAQTIGVLKLDDINGYVRRIRDAERLLIEGNKINKSDEQKIDAMVEEGLMMNIEIHKQYPDRP